MIKTILRQLKKDRDPHQIVGLQMDYSPDTGVRSIHAHLSSGQRASFDGDAVFSFPEGSSEEDCRNVRMDMSGHLSALSRSGIPNSARENIMRTLSQMQHARVTQHAPVPKPRQEAQRCDSSMDF